MTIDYKAFAAGGGANVISQAAFVSALAGALANGFTAGVAPSDQLNKVWRQSSVMSAAIATYIVAQLGGNVLDDGDVAALAVLVENAVAAQISAATTGVPVGGIIYMPGTAAPTGFVKSNGALLSRATYADLWVYAQASGNISINDGAWIEGGFSPGDGSTTFRIPDTRGNFARFWDDARGIDSGRAIGTLQTDAFQGHWHVLTADGTGAGAGGGYMGLQSGGAVVMPQAVKAPNTDGVNGTPRTAAETRPRNIPFLGCIKY